MKWSIVAKWEFIAFHWFTHNRKHIQINVETPSHKAMNTPTPRAYRSYKNGTSFTDLSLHLHQILLSRVTSTRNLVKFITRTIALFIETLFAKFMWKNNKVPNCEVDVMDELIDSNIYFPPSNKSIANIDGGEPILHKFHYIQFAVG